MDLHRADQPTGQEHKAGEDHIEKELDQDLQDDQEASDDDVHKKAQKVEHMTPGDSYSDQDDQCLGDSPVRASNKKRSRDCHIQKKFIKSQSTLLSTTNSYHACSLLGRRITIM